MGGLPLKGKFKPIDILGFSSYLVSALGASAGAGRRKLLGPPTPTFMLTPGGLLATEAVVFPSGFGGNKFVADSDGFGAAKELGAPFSAALGPSPVNNPPPSA